jgi:lysophospholipase L1-like esterase
MLEPTIADSSARSVPTEAEVIAHFISTYRKILDGIRTRVPKAEVILVNVPNEEVIARSYKIANERRSRFGRISTGFDTWINARYPEFPVVNTVCDPRSYDMTGHYNNSVHLNDVGARELAENILKVARAARPPGPAASCEWFRNENTPQ